MNLAIWLGGQKVGKMLINILFKLRARRTRLGLRLQMPMGRRAILLIIVGSFGLATLYDPSGQSLSDRIRPYGSAGSRISLVQVWPPSELFHSPWRSATYTMLPSALVATEIAAKDRRLPTN